MIIAIKIIGAVLTLLGLANLGSLFVIDLSTLMSPTTVVLRYSLMVVAGIGFFLTYKWAIFVFGGSFGINWAALFLVYDGHSFGPIWLSLPIPATICMVTYFAWHQLKPQSASEIDG